MKKCKKKVKWEGLLKIKKLKNSEAPTPELEKSVNVPMNTFLSLKTLFLEQIVL